MGWPLTLQPFSAVESSTKSGIGGFDFYQYVIRSATIHDAGSIARIHIEAWKCAYKGIVPKTFLEEMDIEDRTKRWEKILSESQSKTLVFESTGKITGWMSYGPSRDDDCAGSGEIWALYVSPENWRHGHGSALMKFAEEIAGEFQTPGLVLWVLAGNTRGRRFYERLGYAPDGTTKKIEVGKALLEEIRYRKTIEQSGVGKPDPVAS